MRNLLRLFQKSEKLVRATEKLLRAGARLLKTVAATVIVLQILVAIMI